MQLISSGAFNVHSTQSSEAAHKHNMHLAISRVRHLQVNKTQKDMSKYLRDHYMFEQLKWTVNTTTPAVTPTRRIAGGIHSQLFELNCDGDRVPTTMSVDGLEFRQPQFQKKILHPEVRLARVEILDLLCDQLGLPPIPASYSLLGHLEFTFGQCLRRDDGTVFWATESRYTFATDANATRRGRRDILCFDGVERKTYQRDGSPVILSDALCGEVVCFMRTLNMQYIKPVASRYDSDADTHTWLLVRWFEPHNTLERDSQHRPVCPGPLHINHCLWRHARLPSPRKTISRNGRPSPAFRVQADLFGSTPEEQTARYHDEKYAFYGLVSDYNISHRANMCPIFISGETHELNYSVWLETITMI